MFGSFRGRGAALINHARVVTATTVVTAGATTAGGQCQYELTIIELDSCGIPNGTPPGRGIRVTEAGHVGGYLQQCPPNEPNEDTFIWTPEGGINVIENPWPIISVKLLDMNEREQIVGVLDDVEEAAFLGFFWEDGEFTLLNDFPPNGTNSEANAINEAGQVVGWWGNTIVGGPSVGAFLWQDGKFNNLYPVLGYSKNEATGINDLGHITGWRGESARNRSGFLIINDEIVTIPFMPNSTNSIGVALNNSDQVVGRSWIDVADGSHAWRSFLWENGQMTDLGTLPGCSETFAHDINSHGQIVGYCSGEDVGAAPFLWRDGEMINLNEMIALPDVELDIAHGINDAGQITGKLIMLEVGSLPFLLTPIPVEGDFNSDCAVGPHDLALLLGNWGPCPPQAGCAADLDGDEIVGPADLAVLLTNWG